MPYVFQMLSLLLEIREGTGSIPDPYWALFPCLLVPALWDRSGNVTPLIRLICAFVRQGAAQIVALDKLVSRFTILFGWKRAYEDYLRFRRLKGIIITENSKKEIFSNFKRSGNSSENTKFTYFYF